MLRKIRERSPVSNNRQPFFNLNLRVACILHYLTLLICAGWMFVGGVVLSGCDVVYRFLDKPGAEEKALIGNALPYEPNPTVEQIQSLLKLYGYYSARVDGILGRKTRDAIARFQKDNGLEQTRFVDRNTWDKMNIFEGTEFIQNGRLNIRFIQEILQKEGFSPGKVDGKLGPKTTAAIKAFQKAYGLIPDGKIGYKTLVVLLQRIR